MRAIEEELIRSLKQYSLLQYVLMGKTKDFGEAGYLRVNLDFLRSLLDLPAEHRLTSLDLENFNKHLSKLTLDFRSLPIKELRALEKDFSFILAGKRYKRSESNKINGLLEAQGSDRRLFMGSRKEGFTILLFGPVQIFKHGKFRVHILKKEEVRSPAAILPIAAIANQKHEIIIRKESLEAVFWGKWAAQFLQKNTASSQTKIQNALKRKVLSLYGVDSLDSLRKKKEVFVNELIETTARHEIGHVLFSKAYPDQDLIALGKLLSAKTERSLIEILDEILIEWMPEGVIPFLARLAKKDYSKAKRIFYRYLSDSWFYGNLDQNYLCDLTDLLVPVLFSYIRPDGEVDFERILIDAPRIYAFFLRCFENALLSIKNEIEEAVFSSNGLEISFAQLAKTQRKAFAKQNKQIDPSSSLYKRYFWPNMPTYLKNCAPDTSSSIESLLQDLRRNIKKEILTHLIKEGSRSANLKEYLMLKAKRFLFSKTICHE